MAFDCPNTNLKKGAKGSQVTTLQEGLKKLGYYNKINGYTMKVDGNFGYYTELAVKNFQRSTGHSADGWFGPKTCVSFNQKVYPSSSSTSTTKTSTTTTKTVVTVNQTVKKTEIVIDAKKYNFLHVSKANCTIEGLHFIISQVDDVNSYNVKPWKYVELMDDNEERYPGHVQPLEYKLTTYLTNTEYNKIKPALKLLQQKSSCNVVYDCIESGKYNVSVKRSYQKRNMWKLEFQLREVKT